MIFKYLFFRCKEYKLNNTFESIENKKMIFPKPLKSLDLSKKLPFIITESNILKLIKKDSIKIAIIERAIKKFK